MFENESKEYANKWLEHVKDLALQHKTDEKPEYIRIKEAHQCGAEFAYNKANEWHYVKDGDLPKDEKNFKSYVVAYYGAIGSSANGKPCWEELCYDTEYKRWVDKETLKDIPYVNKEGIVIAWKEIVLPKLKESK